MSSPTLSDNLGHPLNNPDCLYH